MKTSALLGYAVLVALIFVPPAMAQDVEPALAPLTPSPDILRYSLRRQRDATSLSMTWSISAPIS